MSVIPKVQCARCGHEVERIEMVRDLALTGWQVRVWCHGERESSHLRDFDLQGAWEIVEAIAFRQPEQIEALS